MRKSRKISSLKNLIVGVVGQILVIVMQFICRTFFISCLSNEYLGINGLFLNVINILSLSELGFGSALLYSMYKPIAENDNKKLIHILNFYKRIYKIIAIVITIVGFSLTPVLHLLVGQNEYISDIKVIYWLFLINSISSYVLVYKKSLIEANQQNYICVLYQKTCTVVQNILQIIFLIVTHNYMIYLILQIIFTLITNIVLSIKTNKMYPFILNNDRQLPTHEERKEIYKNTVALAYHKFGGVILSNTDNIIMSRYIGLAVVGIYSNYVLISNNLSIFLNIVLQSFTASIGNMGVTENTQKKREIFKFLQFYTFWIYSFCGLCLLNLFNPFIKLWIGIDYLLSAPVIAIIVLNFYITGMRRITCIFIESFGIAYDTKYKVVAETVINLFFSIVLVKRFGLIGIFVGTLIANIAVFWREGFSLYKNSFNATPAEFVINWIKYGSFYVISCVITYNINSSILDTNLINWIEKAMICFIVYHILFVILFWNKPEFKKAIEYIKKCFIRIYFMFMNNIRAKTR